MGATTAAEAIAILEAGGIEEVSLDHDLGPPEAGSGYDVACWIEQAAHEGLTPPMRWNIHSANPVGMQRMTAALTNADRFWSSGRER